MKRLSLLMAFSLVSSLSSNLAAETFICTGGGGSVSCTTSTGPVASTDAFSLEIKFPPASPALQECAHWSEWPSTGAVHRSPTLPNGSTVRHTGCDFVPIGTVLTTGPTRTLRCITPGPIPGSANLIYDLDDNKCVISVWWLGP